jgi:restriction endonuclease S subunit
MTLINKSWLKSEVLRLWLSGDSQEAIANQLKISVGTVNSLVNEIMKSDDTIDFQRQIAIVVKKNGVKIKDIATNLRWKNLIKQSSLDDKKVEKLLDAMDALFNKYGIPLSAAANQFYSIIETMLRENKEPHKLEEELKSKISELREIDNQIETNNKLLEESKATVEEEQKILKIKQKDLDQFRQISQLLQIYNYPEISTEYGAVTRAMIDIKKMGKDPKIIVSKYEEFESLVTANQKLEAKLRESERILQHYKHKLDEEEARWKDRDNAFEIFTRLIKDGLKAEDIFMAVNILKNDYPQSGIEQLIEDIRTYGNITAAKWKSKREYEAESEFPLESP